MIIILGRGCLSIGVESGVETIIEILLDFEANMEVLNMNRYCVNKVRKY